MAAPNLQRREMVAAVLGSLSLNLIADPATSLAARGGLASRDGFWGVGIRFAPRASCLPVKGISASGIRFAPPMTLC